MGSWQTVPDPGAGCTQPWTPRCGHCQRPAYKPAGQTCLHTARPVPTASLVVRWSVCPHRPPLTQHSLVWCSHLSLPGCSPHPPRSPPSTSPTRPLQGPSLLRHVHGGVLQGPELLSRWQRNARDLPGGDGHFSRFTSLACARPAPPPQPLSYTLALASSQLPDAPILPGPPSLCPRRLLRAWSWACRVSPLLTQCSVSLRGSPQLGLSAT